VVEPAEPKEEDEEGQLWLVSRRVAQGRRISGPKQRLISASSRARGIVRSSFDSKAGPERRAKRRVRPSGLGSSSARRRTAKERLTEGYRLSLEVEGEACCGGCDTISEGARAPTRVLYRARRRRSDDGRLRQRPAGRGSSSTRVRIAEIVYFLKGFVLAGETERESEFGKVAHLVDDAAELAVRRVSVRVGVCELGGREEVEVRRGPVREGRGSQHGARERRGVVLVDRARSTATSARRNSR